MLPAQRGESSAGYSRSLSTFTSSVSCAGPVRQGSQGLSSLSPKKGKQLKQMNSRLPQEENLLEVQKYLFGMNSWKTLLKMQRSLCQQKSTWAG